MKTKKLLIQFLMVLFFAGMAKITQAQRYQNFSVEFISPVPNETIYNGKDYTLKFLIKNKSQTPILKTDTVYMLPSINGNFFMYNGRVIVWWQRLKKDLGFNETDTVTAQIFPSFDSSIQNANLCAEVMTSYEGVELDTTTEDNSTCVKVNLSKNGLGIWSVSQTPNFEIYPNPAKTELTIVGIETATDDEWIIHSMLNTKILSIPASSVQNNTIDISGLEAGMYYIRYRNSVQKFVKID